ncbi:MAG: glycosyltransferase family 4 protein [Acidobacteriota bacterium]
MARVVLLDQYAGLGGGQRILMDLARALRVAGHSVRVFLPGRGAAEARLREEGFSVLPLPLPEMTPGRKPMAEKVAYPLHAWRAASALRTVLAEEPADLLYANAPRTFLPAVLASRRGGPPVVLALHLIFDKGLERGLVRWCMRQKEVRRIVFCSGAVGHPFSDVCGTKGAKIHYWVSPRFLEAASERRRARESMGLDSGDLAVGVLGRISRTKGQALFLEALAPLLERHPAARLLVGGGADFEEPEEDARLAKMAGASPHADRILMSGRMVEAIPFLDALDVLVVPSLWEEPFGLVAVEGMARGLPVVATRSGGLVEIVDHGVTGFLADKDAASLRGAVERLLADPALRAAMGERGRARVESEFHPAKQIAEVLALCFEE